MKHADTPSNTRITRRQFAVTAGYAFASVAFSEGCAASTNASDADNGRLTARPGTGIATSLGSGPLGLGSGGRDGEIQMPTAMPDGNVPLLVFLHGAAQSGAETLRRIGPAADPMGYDVTFREFDGRHEMPPDVASEALRWMAAM